MEWALLPLLFAHWLPPQDQPLHRAHEPYTFTLRPSHLPVWMLRIGYPLGHELSERLSPRWRDVFAVDLVAALQQPIDFIEAAASVLQTHGPPRSPLFPYAALFLFSP